MSQSSSENVNRRPYPGLRPFREDETDVFFGRETQTDEQLVKLRQSHFLAVIGPSGCGKSSLVRTGVLDSLRSGMLNTRPSGPPRGLWNVVDLRPGDSPMWNLARALYRSVQPEATADTDEDQQSSYEEIATTRALLSRGIDGMSQFLRNAEFPDDTNLLIMVDQFEELFRFRDVKRGDASDEDAKYESERFVNLLIDAAKQRDLPIYVIITMRTSFVENCFEFRGLPEMINSSQFLTPILNEKQLRRAIVGPAKVFGGEVSLDLLKRLIEEFGPDPDCLPLLQHALMRTWNAAEKRLVTADADEPMRMTLEDYEKIGGLHRALSIHANEALSELQKEDPAFAPLVETLFRELTYRTRGTTAQDTRRPRRIREIAIVAGLHGDEWKKLVPIVNAFQEPTRNFLVAYSKFGIESATADEITEDTVLDISHESLIREWQQLRKWVDEEAKKAEKYIALAQHANSHQQNEGGYLTSTQVKYYGKWWDRQRPSALWAARYPGNFKETREFLRRSKYYLFFRRTVPFAIILAILGYVFLNLQTERAQTTDRLNALLDMDDIERVRVDDVVVDSVVQYLWSRDKVPKLVNILREDDGQSIPDDYGFHYDPLEPERESFAGGSSITLLYNLPGQLNREWFLRDWRTHIRDEIQKEQMFPVPDPTLAYHPGLEDNTIALCASNGGRASDQGNEKVVCPEGQHLVYAFPVNLPDGYVLVAEDAGEIVASVHKDRFSMIWEASATTEKSLEFESGKWRVMSRWTRPIWKLGDIEVMSREHAIVRLLKPRLLDSPLDLVVEGSEMALLRRTESVSPMTVQYARQLDGGLLRKLVKKSVSNEQVVPDLTYQLNAVIDGISEFDRSQSSETVTTPDRVDRLHQKAARITEQKFYPKGCDSDSKSNLCLSADLHTQYRCGPDTNKSCVCAADLKSDCESPITAMLDANLYDELVVRGAAAQPHRISMVAAALTRVQLDMYEQYGVVVPAVVFEKPNGSPSTSVEPRIGDPDESLAAESIERISAAAKDAYRENLKQLLTLDDTAASMAGNAAFELNYQPKVLQVYNWPEIRRLMHGGLDHGMTPANVMTSLAKMVDEEIRKAGKTEQFIPTKVQDVTKLKPYMSGDLAPDHDFRVCDVPEWRTAYLPSARKPILLTRAQYSEFVEFGSTDGTIRKSIYRCLFNEDLGNTLSTITEWRDSNKTTSEQELLSALKLQLQFLPQTLTVTGEEIDNDEILIQLLFGFLIINDFDSADKLASNLREKGHPRSEYFGALASWARSGVPEPHNPNDGPASDSSSNEVGDILSAWFADPHASGRSGSEIVGESSDDETSFEKLLVRMLPGYGGGTCNESSSRQNEPGTTSADQFADAYKATALLLLAANHGDNVRGCFEQEWQKIDARRTRWRSDIGSFKEMLLGAYVGEIDVDMQHIIDDLKIEEKHSHSIFGRMPRKHLLCTASFYKALLNPEDKKEELLDAAKSQRDPQCLEGIVAKAMLDKTLAAMAAKSY